MVIIKCYKKGLRITPILTVLIIKKKEKVEMKAAILHRTEAPRAITDVTLSALGLKYSISEVGYGAASVLNGALIFSSLE